jgi:hypothetical protein
VNRFDACSTLNLVLDAGEDQLADDQDHESHQQGSATPQQQVVGDVAGHGGVRVARAPGPEAALEEQHTLRDRVGEVDLHPGTVELVLDHRERVDHRGAEPDEVRQHAHPLLEVAEEHVGDAEHERQPEPESHHHEQAEHARHQPDRVGAPAVEQDDDQEDGKLREHVDPRDQHGGDRERLARHGHLPDERLVLHDRARARVEGLREEVDDDEAGEDVDREVLDPVEPDDLPDHEPVDEQLAHRVDVRPDEAQHRPLVARAELATDQELQEVATPDDLEQAGVVRRSDQRRIDHPYGARRLSLGGLRHPRHRS